VSSERDRIRELAERVARRLDAAKPDGGVVVNDARSKSAPDEVAALRAGLSEIQQRLAHIESHIAHKEDRERETRGSAPPRPSTNPGAGRQAAQTSAPPPTRSMWLSGTYVPATAHPSQEKFAGIGEAVSELVDFFESEKTCNVEPGGKPCDHCGMCSSRGF
jgi:hypothetical protein